MDAITALVRLGVRLGAAVGVRWWQRRRARYGKHARGHRRDDDPEQESDQ